MNNRLLKYMSDNNPENTISKNGVMVRNKIRPLLWKVLALNSKLKLEIEKKEFKGSDRPIIYTASHSFKDDAVNTVLTAKCNAYFVVGNTDLFYNTLDGFFLWLYGSQLVDRYDKESRNAMKSKMNKVIEYGSNILIFPEATWNLSPNKLMYNLHWGFYEIAKENNALVVPIITYKVGNKCYSRMLDGIDVNDVTLEDIDLIIKKLNKYINKANDVLIFDGVQYLSIKNELVNIKNIVSELNNKQNENDFNNLLNQISSMCLKVVNDIKCLLNEENEHVLKVVINYLQRMTTIEKEVVTERIRDIMATEKFDMISKHPDNTFKERSSSIYEEWDKYLEETIKATPYFYLEPEKTTECTDKLIVSEEEVFCKTLKK